MRPKELIYKVLSLNGPNAILACLFKWIYRRGLIKSFVFPFKGDLSIEVEGAKFLMASDGGDSVASKLYMQDYIAFEPEVFRVFAAIAPKIKSFFDIGANTGAYTLFVQSINPDCTIKSFEPVPAIFKNLAINCKLNNFDRIDCKQLGLGERTGQLSFYVPKSIRLPTAGSLTENYRSDTEKILVKVVRLDDLIQQEGLYHLDFIKIDTESTEPSVIRGGLGCIKQFRPIMLIEVLQPKEAGELKGLLAPLDYQFFQILPDGLRPTESLDHGAWPQNWNFLFVPEEKVETLRSFQGLEILA